ncbi:hypothetical protein RRG08_006768 [Elysia crispata]|uniref:Uncharacterized protein n=1 Tax=Elysia crispata TaxID=231223 RepID=A0AAE0YAV1_9GAST|nr:hypothetical protein RRG08_006768 [Elysia crispata]
MSGGRTGVLLKQEVFIVGRNCQPDGSLQLNPELTMLWMDGLWETIIHAEYNPSRPVIVSTIARDAPL